MTKRLLFSLILGVCFLTSTYGQKTEIGLLGGTSIYSGDISPKEFGLYFNDIRPAVGFLARINATKALSVRLGLNYSQVSSNDNENGRPERGLSFRSNILEGHVMAEVNLFRLGNKKGVQVVPFIASGVGIFNFNPQGEFEGNWIDLQPLGTEGQGSPGYPSEYQLTQLNIPVGGGLKFIFNESWTIGLEMTGRKLFTDYLDDVSGIQEVVYFDVLDENGVLAAHFSDPTITDPVDASNEPYIRGGKYNDWYYFANATITFKFGGNGGNNRNIGCPTF